MTSEMPILGPFWLDTANLSYFDHITITNDTNLIPYPIGNSSGNPMVSSSNSQNYVIWSHAVKMAILTRYGEFELFWPHYYHLWYKYIPNANISLSHRKFIREPNDTFSNSQNDVIWPYNVIMASKWPFLALFYTKSHIWAILTPLLAVSALILYTIP